MQYCTALPSDRRNKATRRERLVFSGRSRDDELLAPWKNRPEWDVLAIWCGYESVTRGNRISYQLIHCTVWCLANDPMIHPCPSWRGWWSSWNIRSSTELCLNQIWKFDAEKPLELQKESKLSKKNIGFQKSSKPFCELHLTSLRLRNAIRVCQGFPFKKNQGVKCKRWVFLRVEAWYLTATRTGLPPPRRWKVGKPKKASCEAPWVGMPRVP